MIPLLLLLAIGASERTTTTPSDPTLRDAERAFTVMQNPGSHGYARKLLIKVTAAFADRTLDENALKQTFVSDVNKPWRGLPHERELAFLALAALDMERGRCDLALPSIQSALLAHTSSTAPKLARALRYRCLVDLDAPKQEIEEASRDVDDAILSNDARLLFGSAVVRLSRDEAPRVTRRLCGEEPLECRPPSKQDAKKTSGTGTTLWKKQEEEQHAKARPFQKTLDERARFQQEQQQRSQQAWAQAQAQKTSTTQWVGAFLSASAAAGHAGLAGATDARVDTRRVTSLPESVVLVVK